MAKDGPRPSENSQKFEKIETHLRKIKQHLMKHNEKFDTLRESLPRIERMLDTTIFGKAHFVINLT